MRKAPGTRHRRLVLIALGIAVVLIAAALLWGDNPPIGPPPTQ